MNEENNEVENKTHEHKESEHKTHKHANHKHVYMEHHEHKKSKTYKIATWVLAGVSIVLLLALIFILASGTGSNNSGTNSASELEVKKSVENYLNGISAGSTVDSIEDRGGIYYVALTVEGRQYESYATKDGKLLFPQGIDLTQPAGTPAESGSTPQPTNVPQTDKPVVELFVMSHCPYGTQAEKGILPAALTLGDTIDFKIRFVYYAMHGEKEVQEQLTQYCIQTEQSDKYLKYLACFLNDSAGQGSASASDACIKNLNIDTKKLETCKTAADEEFNIMANFNDRASWLNGNFPKFDTDLAANEQYGVGGSPTLVINGVQSNAGRDSASYLSAICAAFTEAPAECETVLSNTQPGPGFGYDSVGAANAAGCGV